MRTSTESAAGLPAVKWNTLSSKAKAVDRRSITYSGIVARLIGYTEAYWPQVSTAATRKSSEEQTVLDSLLDLIEEATGMAAHALDPAMVMRRIGWRMQVNGIDDLASYKALIDDHPTELSDLRKSLIIRVTDFFRDPNVFFQLEQQVIPQLVEQSTKKGLRILIHGCQTGEEAYSLAMMLAVYLRQTKKRIPVRILANDPDKNDIVTARRGFYPHLITADLSALCLDQFFEATREGYCVVDQLRQVVRFMSGHEDDPAASADLDLLVCRNPLLLADESSGDQLLATFFSRLKPEGWLVVDPGMQRSPHISKYFDEIDRDHGIYRRKPTVGRALEDQELTALGEEFSRERVRSLEEARYHTYERLKLAVKEYETTHDDLVDRNHALHASVRETSLEKDQLAAEHNALLDMKEGILKANKAFKSQNDRLRRSMMRLEAVMSCSNAEVLCLNNELGIELFTPGVGILFGLKSGDVGRPFSSLETPFKLKIEEAAGKVLQSHVAVERELASKEGQWYRIAISPLVFEENVQGVVCTFIDVTEQRRIAEWNRYKANALEHMTDAVLMTNRDLQITYMNRAAVDRYNLHHKKKAGVRLNELYKSIWRSQEEREVAHRTMAEKGFWSGQHVLELPGGKRSRVNTALHLLKDRKGEELGMMTIVRDAQPIKEDPDAIQDLISDLERRNTFLDDHGTRTTL